MSELPSASQQYSRPPSQAIKTRFNYIYGYDLNVNVYVKICSLEGSRPVKNYMELLNDPMAGIGNINLDEGNAEDEGSHMYVTVQVFGAIIFPESLYCLAYH